MQRVSRLPRWRFTVVCIVPAAAAVGLFLGGPWSWLGVAVYGLLYLAWDGLGPRDVTPPLAEGGRLLDGLLFVQVPLVLLAWLGLLAAFSASQTMMPFWVCRRFSA